jgi:hypothetical protein
MRKRELVPQNARFKAARDSDAPPIASGRPGRGQSWMHPLSHKGEGDFADAHFTRSKSVVQLVSHVRPPSGENACSQWACRWSIGFQMKRTLIGFPRNVSSA